MLDRSNQSGHQHLPYPQKIIQASATTKIFSRHRSKKTFNGLFRENFLSLKIFSWVNFFLLVVNYSKFSKVCKLWIGQLIFTFASGFQPLLSFQSMNRLFARVWSFDIMASMQRLRQARWQSTSRHRQTSRCSRGWRSKSGLRCWNWLHQKSELSHSSIRKILFILLMWCHHIREVLLNSLH